MFTVYVIRSTRCQKIYVGFTSDMDARLAAHNHPKNKGWTRNFMPWEIIYSEEYETKREALKRERQLKSARGRRFIRNLFCK